MPLFIVCLTFLAFQCEDDLQAAQKEEQTTLLALKTEIETIANSSVCSESTECQYIAFGSKPCGGPWSYIIYSSSIDTNTLETLVTSYNEKEHDFNIKYGIVSTCDFVSPPSSVECENNICVAVN